MVRSLRTLAGVADSVQYDAIVPETIYNKVVEYAKPRLVLRNVSAFNIGPGEIKGRDIEIPIQTSATIERKIIAEGAQVPYDFQEVTSRNLRPIKYGDTVVITQEAIEDSVFSPIEMNTRAVGERLARNEEVVIAAVLSANAGNTTAGATSVDIDDLRASMLDLTGNDFTPTDLVLSPNLVNDLLGIDTYVEANKIGVSDPTQGLVGRIYGMNVWEGSTVLNDTGKYTGYVIDRNNAFVFGEKRPVTMKVVEEPDYDRVKYVFTQRMNAQYLHANAISKIDITP